MAIQKLDFNKITKEQTPYTVILNSVIQHIENLEALALWTYLFSLPSDWAVNKEHLKSKFKIGDDKLKSIFSYLKRSNLIEYKQERNKEGLLNSVVIHVLCGDKFDKNELYKNTGRVKNTPTVLTAGGLTTRAENHTSGFRALQKKENKKEIKIQRKQKSFCVLNAKKANEKKHSWADMKNEKASIEKNNVIKRTPMPEDLRNFYKSLCKKGI